MHDLKQSGLFALRFVVVFAVLVLPWPGFREAFAAEVRTELRLVLKLLLPRHDLQVGRHVDPQNASVDIEVRIGGGLGPDGQPQTRVVGFDSRSLGWMPHAMILALCAATKLPWRSWWKFFLIGLVAVHLFVIVSMLANVFAGLVTGSSPAWEQWLVPAAYHVLVENLWLSYVGPFLIWAVCCVWLGNVEGNAPGQPRPTIP